MHLVGLGLQFDTITFVHIPRSSNTYADYLDNGMLDLHLSHV